MVDRKLYMIAGVNYQFVFIKIYLHLKVINKQRAKDIL